MKNAKKQIGVWFLTALLLAVMSFSAFAVDSFTVSAEANKTSANVGDVITVNVVLSKGAPVSVATVILKYDPACFEYQNNAAFTDLCKKDGVSGNINDKVSGEITFAAITEGSFSEGGTMLTASFKVLKVNSEFSLTLKTIGQDDFDATNITEYGTVKGVKIACAHGSTQEKVVNNATHTQAGQKATVCTACNATIKTEPIPAQGHTFSAWKVTTPATCIKEGVETRTCSCGISETRSVSKTAHTPGEWVETKSPTCTDAGEEEQKCSICKTLLSTQAIPAKGHTPDKWEITKEATCTELGSKKATCTVCGKEFTEEIPALGHTADKWETVKNATCTQAGERKATCTVCGEEFTETIPALGHKYGKWTVTKEATKTAEGKKERECSVCGEKETAVIPVLGTQSTETDKSTVTNTEIPNTRGNTVEYAVISTIGFLMVFAIIGIFVYNLRKKQLAHN